MGEYRELFEFAAKAGALEGYLYERANLEPLDNWVSNIEKMYANLSVRMKADIRNEVGAVLTRTLTYGGHVVEVSIRTRLNNLLNSL